MLTASDLERYSRDGCSDPLCHHKHEKQPLTISARCHPDRGLNVAYMDYAIELSCSVCGDVVEEILVGDKLDLPIEVPKNTFSIGDVRIVVFLTGNNDSCTVVPVVIFSDDATLDHKLAAAEILTHIVSRDNPDGYEKSLENIAQGAMKYILNKGK